MMVVAVCVFATVAVGGITALILDYRRHGRRAPTTAYCANASTVAYVGGGEYACLCHNCSDRVIIRAATREAARSKYSAHPCAAMPAPSHPQK